MPRPVSTAGSQVQAYVQPLPPPGPKTYWSPSQVVLGFLHASASYAFDRAAALEYLSPKLRRSWHPGPVTVVSSLSPAKQLPYHPQAVQAGPAEQYKSVQFSGQRLATLSQTGQYLYSPGTSTYQFILTQVNGGWLISTLPLGGQSLLLTQNDFEHVYQPRNLFFFAPQNSWAVNGNLVPDPVYAPLQSANSALNTTLATGLVEGLLTDDKSWLSGATTTSFPPGTKLIGITFDGQTAVVNLAIPAAERSKQHTQSMVEQLLATLGSKAYSAPLAHNVELVINGRVAYDAENPNLVFPVHTAPLIYQGSPGAVDENGTRSSLVTAAELGSGTITALAASGTSGIPQPAVAAEDGHGCALFLPVPGSAAQTGQQYRSYRLSTSGGPCTSLSWDANDNLWAVAGDHIWVLRTSTRQVVPVTGPANLPVGGQSGTTVLSLQMAPDGVRAALLLKTAAGNRLVLAAVTSSAGRFSLGRAVAVGTGLASPVAVSWYSPYELVALTSTGIWEVPLTGGAGQLLAPAPADAVSLTTDGSTLVVGTSSGEILTSATDGNSWVKAASGSIPSYSS